MPIRDSTDFRRFESASFHWKLENTQTDSANLSTYRLKPRSSVGTGDENDIFNAFKVHSAISSIEFSEAWPSQHYGGL